MANHRNHIRSRGGAKRKTDDNATPDFDLDDLDLPEQQRPFIESDGLNMPGLEGPTAINHASSAPGHNQLESSLNYAIGDNDNILMDDPLLDDLERLDSSMKARGFECAELDAELAGVKISRSENVVSKFQVSPIRQEYVSKMRAPKARKSPILPKELEKFAQFFAEGKVGIVDTADVIDSTTGSAVRNVNGDAFLLRLSSLPRDCGPRTLVDLIPDSCDIVSVHLVVDMQMAVIRVPGARQLNEALEHAQKAFKWNPQIIADSPYLQFSDGQIVWQYQDSNRWTSCHPAMGQLIEKMPDHTFQLISHGSRKYFVEKYNSKMGRQTNFRSGNQRNIQSVEIRVWAQHGDEEESEERKRERNAVNLLFGFQEDADSPVAAPGPLTEPAVVTGSAKEEVATEEVVTDEVVTEVIPTEEVDRSEIVMDDNEYLPLWELQTEDDEVYEAMAEHVGMEEVEDDDKKMSGVWRCTKDPPAAPIDEGLERMEDLFFVPDAHDAAKLFGSGEFEGNVSLAFCGSLFRAVELNTFGDECDDKHNVKVFVCNVYLDAEQREELEDTENCTVTNVEHIEVVMCASVNIELLKEVAV